MEENNNAKGTCFKVHESITDPPHKLEIAVIGAGGTGSQVLQGLARMNLALESLGHPGLYVYVYDPDKVEEQNIGRQLFSLNDVGKHKASCLVSKINRFYGYSWTALNRKFNTKEDMKNVSFFLSCVDNVAFRHQFNRQWKKDRVKSLRGNPVRQVFWIDFGNGKDQGQVVMGSLSHTMNPFSLQSIGDIGIPKEDDPQTPSCSLAEALDKQDLMINPMIANTGLSMMWQMFRTLKVSYNVSYLNLGRMKMNSTLKTK